MCIQYVVLAVKACAFDGSDAFIYAQGVTLSYRRQTVTLTDPSVAVQFFERSAAPRDLPLSRSGDKTKGLGARGRCIFNLQATSETYLIFQSCYTSNYIIFAHYSVRRTHFMTTDNGGRSAFCSQRCRKRLVNSYILEIGDL